MLCIILQPSGHGIFFAGVGKPINDAEDGDRVTLPGWLILTKRGEDELNARLARVMRDVVAASTLPLLSQSRTRLFEIEVPSGNVLPSASAGFENLVHIALIKLDFMSRGERAKARGKALIDVALRAGVDPGELASTAEDVDESDEATDEERPAKYWAGGDKWGNESMLAKFLSGNTWQLGWSSSSKEASARTAWRRFEDVRPGDYFAIKSVHGSDNLKVHYVGRVTEIDASAGHLRLEPLPLPKYSGKAPGGPGVGSWFDALVPITRTDVIASLFGESAATAAEPAPGYDDVPRNLILYGPPGTGKTYRLQTEYMTRFTRKASQLRDVDAAMTVASELSYFELFVAAVYSAPGKRATVPQIMTHPLVRAKYQLNAPKNLRQVVWGTLGHHTIEASKTVHMKRRFGELVFDKDGDGNWFFPSPLPSDLRDTAERALKSSTGSQGKGLEIRDYEFVTFHQAYAYEDFIEGIRPSILDDDSGDEDEGGIGYTLEAGVFKRAALKALQLTKFQGSLDEFCKLGREERTKYLEGAPHFAVFIDEINRGNVARVLGELITLLEDDKRLGAENELIVTLPYSKTLFGVPSNLHVIGTMNTADRSVEALDAALRRRFEFREMAPRPEELKFVIDGPIDPHKLLRTINRRLEKLRDRDHCIGDAYFRALEDDPTLDALKNVFASKILPLLQEYFFGDWGKIGLVLGKDFVRKRTDNVDLADFPHDDRDVLRSRTVYEMTPIAELTDQSFRRIYENDAPSV